MRTDNPACPLCGEYMVKEIYGEGFRCIYPHPRRSNSWIIAAVLAFLIGSVLFVACGCTSTVTAPKIQDTQASWDGNQQNSGFLGFDAQDYGIITAHARDRYNALIAMYGSEFKPRLDSDAGVHQILTPTTDSPWRIDKQHLTHFMTMNRWRKEGKILK
jgi:hypothetical protein